MSDFGDNVRVPYAKTVGITSSPQRIRRGDGVIAGPNLSKEQLEEIRKIIDGESSKSGLSYDEVQKKIQQAIKFTKSEEAKRYKNGIDNLAEQLNLAKVKIKTLENKIESYVDELLVKDKFINELNEKLSAKNSELDEMYKRLDNILVNDGQSEDISYLRNTIEIILNKVSSINVVGNTEDIIEEEKVFIDPSEDRTDLKPHININSDEDYSRNVLSDVDKLRNLINKKKK
jgi:chromosome segregation ATPase